MHQSAATVSRRRFRYLWFLLLSWAPVSLLPESLPEYRLSFLVVSLLAFWCRLMAEGSKAAVLGGVLGTDIPAVVRVGQVIAAGVRGIRHALTTRVGATALLVAASA